jgi:hypothetical protein
MDYKLHYERLISRAKERGQITLSECHHVIPRCIGGDDDEKNLVYLTPEEHYVAHQLLIKIYPNSPKLVYAAWMMRTSSTNQSRNNKTYGWIKRRYISICRQRVGSANSSYGRKWYHDPLSLKNGKFCDTEIPNGWVAGRVPKRTCICCGDSTAYTNGKYCISCREVIQKQRPLVANGYRTKEQELIDLYTQGHSVHKSLQLMGYKTGNSGPLSGWAKQVISTIKK